MKLPGLLCFLFIAGFSSPAFSADNRVFNEFECEFELRDGTEVSIEIEIPFARRSRRDVRMFVGGGSGAGEYNYLAVLRNRQGRLMYSAPSFRLSIDLWPDGQPRWGRSYRADLQTWDLEGRNYYGILCRYTAI